MAVLSIIPTPIGNLSDITLRAIEALKNAKIILCEDTRVTSKLLKLLNIEYSDKKLVSFFEYNEKKRLPSVMDLLKSDFDIALVSDAGTPLLSDPGFPLVREIRRINDPKIKIDVLPGATSITTALVLSGLPTDKFTFIGYTPRKPNDRKKLFKSILRANQHLRSTYIAFETSQRLLATLEAVREIFKPEIFVVLCRELTKMHESVESGKLYEIIDLVKDNKLDLRGEIVIVFNLNNDT